MKNVMKLHFCTVMACTLLLLTGCYKEDTQILYSRQYVIPDLTKLRDSLNNNLNGLRDGLIRLEQKEPISNIAYVTQNGDTVGVSLTFGTQTVYVPFGRNGNNGSSYVVTMGTDGNWYINGQDTGNPWRGVDGTDGVDGLTPVFGIKQDTDGNFYWTIKWPNQSETFMTDASGNKIRANGQDGAPGTDSPLREITEDANNYYFKVQYPGGTPVTYTIPKVKDIGFYIQPDQATSGGASASTEYDATTNTLTFSETNKEMAFPYTKNDELGSVIAHLPLGWTARIDETAKMIYVKAPSMIKSTTVPDKGLLSFTTRTASGLTYERNVNVYLPKRIYLDYFFNESPSIATQAATSTDNKITIPAGRNYSLYLYAHKASGGTFSRIFAQNLDEGIDVPTRLAKLKQTPYVSWAKADDDTNYSFGSFLFNKDSLQVVFFGDNLTNPSSYLLIRKNESTVALSPVAGKAVLVDPVPWDTYGVLSTGNTGEYSYYKTMHLRRLTQRTILRMVDPYRWFSLPAGEVFDPSKIVLYQATTWGWTVENRMYAMYYPVNGVNKLVTTKATNCAAYDASTKLLYAEFSAFPTIGASALKLYIEYTRPDGSIIRKVAYGGSSYSPNSGLAASTSGATVIYNLGYRVAYGSNSSYESSISVNLNNGNTSATPIVLYNIAATDEF